MDENQMRALQALFMEELEILQRPSFYRTASALVPGDEIGAIMTMQPEPTIGIPLPMVKYGKLLMPKRLPDNLILLPSMLRVREASQLIYNDQKKKGATHEAAWDFMELQLTSANIEIPGEGVLYQAECMPFMLRVDMEPRINEIKQLFAKTGLPITWPEMSLDGFRAAVKEHYDKKGQAPAGPECGSEEEED